MLALLWTVLGAALAQLFRGVPSALVVILVVPLVVEQLVDLGGATEIDFLDRWVSGGVFAGFVAIVLTVAWALFTRRDA